jgi:hypothetical protein
MATYSEINTDAWMRLLADIARAGGGGCYGTLAMAGMLRALVVNTRATLDGLPSIPSVQSAVNPVRSELALLESRSESYVTRLSEVSSPPSDADRLDCERIYFWLTTGVTPDEPPAIPVLRMGDARLGAQLWNQVAAVAASEASIASEHPLPDAFTLLRETIGNAERQLIDSAAPGETPTLRDAVVTTMQDAAADVSAFVQARTEDIARAARWLTAGAVALLLLYLVYRLRQK